MTYNDDNQKSIYTIEERNSAVEENLLLIDKMMAKHRDVIKAARMDKKLLSLTTVKIHGLHGLC